MQTAKMSDIPALIGAVMASKDRFGRPRRPYLKGPSGVGKTEAVEQWATEEGYDLVPVYLITKDPVELGGFPVVKEGHVEWVPVKMFTKGKGAPKLYFFDEIPHAPTSVQSIAYQIFNENRVGDHMLPDDCAIIGAGNRAKDKGVHNRVPNPLRRRWYEIEIAPDINSWSQWAVQSDVDPAVIGFLRWKSDMLYQDMEGEELAPDPRAWVMISDLLKANPGMGKDMRLLLVTGKVGEGAAIEFDGFMRLYQDLPNIDNLILSPMKAEVPKNPAILYAIATTLGRRMSVGNCGSVIKYLNRLQPEYGVLAMKDALIRDKVLQSAPEVTKWAIQNQEVAL